MQESFMPSPSASPFKTIVQAGLVAGILDGLAAVLLYMAGGGRDISQIFQYIVSAAIGEKAFRGGATLAWWGVFLHFFIAIFFSLIFYLVYPKLKKLHIPIFLLGLLYGLFIWVVMNLLILPLTRLPHTDLSFIKAASGILAVMFCAGLPIALMIRKREIKNKPV